MIALYPKLCFQPGKTSQPHGIIKIPHRPPRKLLFVLSPFGQTVHLLLVPKAYRRTGQMNIHVHLCWSRSFFSLSLSFEYCDLSIGSCTIAQATISVRFLKRRSQVHDARHCPALSSILSWGFLGIWIFLSVSNSPYRNGSRIQSAVISNSRSLPNFEFVCFPYWPSEKNNNSLAKGRHFSRHHNYIIEYIFFIYQNVNINTIKT